MSELPTILVTNGWKTDRNRKLTSVTIPSTVKTLNAPTKVTFMGATLSAIPSTAAALQEFEAPNCTTVPKSAFTGYTNLTRVALPSVTTLSVANTSAGDFTGCTSLQSITLTSLATLSASTNIYPGGTFYGCTALQTVSLPSLTTITGTARNGGISASFGACTALKSVYMPVLVTCGDSNSSLATFYNCTSLEAVQLGSEGHAVTSIGAYMFRNCTQPGLTITVYTTGGASLANEPWGATNATIVYETA